MDIQQLLWVACAGMHACVHTCFIFVLIIIAHCVHIICIDPISNNDHRSSDCQLVSYYSCFCYRTELNEIIIIYIYMHYVVAYNKLNKIVHGKLLIYIILLLQ